MKTAVNLIGFQIIWWLMILYHDRYIAIALILLIGHLLSIRDQRCEAMTLLGIGLIGTITDSILTAFGLFIFPADNALTILPVPLWLIVLWFGFAATLRHSMKYLSGKRWLAAVFGGIGGPLSYMAGERFDAVAFGFSTPVVLIVLCIIWALLLPLAFMLISSIETRLASVKIFHGEA